MNARRFILALALVLTSVTGWTQTTSLVLTDDTHIADDAGDWLQADRNYGSRPLMLVHDWGPFHALVRFDAAAISGQTVDSATLRLYLADLRAGGSIRVHAITSPWTESSVTWNTGPSYEPVPEAVIAVGSADVGSTVSIDLTDLAAKWASGAVQNHGVLLRTTEPIRAEFDTKETPGGVPAELEIMASTEPSVYAKVLDFTDPDDCIIDEPGYYILDRSWDFSPPDPQGACAYGISIESDPVKLDLQGYELKCEGCVDWHQVILASVDYGDITIRNGAVTGLNLVYGRDYAIRMDSGRVENLRVAGQLSKTLYGNGSLTIFHSSLGAIDACEGAETHNPCGGSGKTVIANSTVAWVFADGSEGLDVRDSKIEQLGAYGTSVLVSRNVIEGQLHFEGVTGIVSWNVIDSGSVGIRVGGSPLVIEGNIIRSSDIGILFESSGSTCYVGNNRVSASTPFVGLEGQIDWGGNVSF